MAKKVMVTREQLRQIWGIAKNNSMEADQLRGMAEQISGKPSLSGLSKSQANDLIDWLKKGTNPNRISTRQLWKISEFEKELGWADNPQRMEGFISKYGHVDRREWLTRNQAIAVIDGLKNLVKWQSA
jgi:Protein of unknown function (DUF1018).